MLIYIIDIATIFICSIIYSIMDNKKNNKKLKEVVLLIPFIALYLTLALKSTSVGTDIAPSYKPAFFDISNMSIDTIVTENIFNVYKNFEMGFVLFTKIISLFTADFQVYMAITYFVIITILYKFIKENSKMPFVSLILFYGLSFYTFFCSGIRQSIAMIVVLYAYKFIKSKSFVKFLISVIIATLFHRTAIVFLPAYFIYRIRLNKVIAFIYCFIFGITVVFKEALLNIVCQMFNIPVNIESTGAYPLLIAVSLITIFSFFFYNKLKQENDENIGLFNFCLVIFYLVQFIIINQIAVRLMYYYYMYMIIFIPYIFNRFKDKNTKTIMVVLLVIFVTVYFLVSGVYALNCMPYEFFWG